MKSATKVSVDFAQLEVACSDLLGQTLVAAEEFNDGWFNAAYGLLFESGQTAVIKVAPPSEIETMTYERDIIETEHEVMSMLQGVIRLPKVLESDLDGFLIGRPLIIMERLRGTTLNKVIDKLPASAIDKVRKVLGNTAQQIHSLKGDAFGMIQGPFSETWPMAFSNLFVDVVQDGRRKNLELPYEDCLDLLAETQTFLSDVSEPRLVHWDLWDGNVFVDPDSGEFVGVIDFERALYGDPLIEFCAMTLTDDVKAGYGNFDFDSKSAVARRRVYNLYLYLIMSIEGQYRQFEDQTSTVWAKEKLAECLA